MLRILIIIFALNTFAPPATAAIACEMMDSASMVVMDQMDDMSNTEINCGMHEDVSCTSTQCITSCAIYTPLLALASANTFNIDWWNFHPQYFIPPLYKIYLPINTPPPLV